MKKRPMDMNYAELNDTLDSLLKSVDLPSSVDYSSERMNYHRYKKSRLFVSTLSKRIKAGLFYRLYIKNRLGSFREERFLKSFKPFFYIFKIGLPDLLTSIGGKFDDALAANYMIAAMLYDASCDHLKYRKYLKEFEDFIMFNKDIVPKDDYLTLATESMNYIKSALDKNVYETFLDYMKIEHVTQLMSIYQLSDKSISKNTLFKITLAKGGITIMAGIYIMAPNMTPQQRKAIFEIGGVLQILEDIHDIDEDLNIGIQTLSNQKLIEYQDIRQLYFGTVNNLIEQCKMDPHRPNSTLDIFYWLLDVVIEKKYAPYF